MRNNKTIDLVLTSLFAAIIIIMAFTPLGYIPLVVINATIIHIPVILGSLFCGPKKGAFLGFVFGLTSCLKSTFMPTSLSAFVFSPVIASSVVGPVGIVKSICIAFIPRILVGVVPYFVYVAVRKALYAQNKKLWATVLNLVMGIFVFFAVNAFLAKGLGEKMDTNVATIVAVAVAVVIFILVEVMTFLKNAQILCFSYAGIAGAMTNTILVMGGIFVLYKDAYAKAVGVAAEAVLGVIAGVISFNGVIEAIVAAIIVYIVGFVLLKLKPIKAA